ncbi:cilia- and flagella-associated protein 97-like [Pogonomyrmex barbatus]|uniref:Cilia- and flagella-associated protein 97-like n=1 Tax=Pogonomyrmex barbatus TaxID=144034 RepID=A0A6I9WUR2_9HYME|nr:cilia- and flagella-associated protein 97-like [Pogonomyrmex barbatus]
MANPNETKIICECRYIPEEESIRETSDRFNNIHEFDEEESETEATLELEWIDPSASDEKGNEDTMKTKETLDDESTYKDESFCSDESCDESEITNVTSGSLNSSSLFRVSDLQFSQSSKQQDTAVNESTWRENQDESYSLNNESRRVTTTDKNNFAKSRKSKRWNMTFTDEEMRRIERENELLLRKIMAQQKPRHKILNEGAVQSRTSSSAINRKKLQKKIENDNMLLLRRIQQAKSCVFANASKMGCRLTFL